MSQTATGAAEQLLAKIKSGATAVEESWIELLEQPIQNAQFYREFARGMRKNGALESAHTMILMLMDQLLASEDFTSLYTVARAVAHFWPDSPEIRKHASKALKGLHGSNPNFSAMIAACKGLPLENALEKFESFDRLAPGNVYGHAYWGEGIIKNLDMTGNQVVAEFEDETRTLPMDFFLKHLKYLPPGSFLALRTTNVSKLEEMAEEDPAGMVRLALAGAADGRLKQSELKELVIPVIGESAWTSWWQRARNDLRVDSMIDIDAKGGARAEIALRKTPKTFEEELEEVFFSPDVDLSARSNLVAQAQKSGVSSPELLKKMIQQLEREYVDGTSFPLSRKLAYAFMQSDLSALSGGAGNESRIDSARDLISQADSYTFLPEMDNQDYAIRALKMLLDKDGKAAAAKAAAIFPFSQSRLAQAIWKEIDTDEHVQVAAHAMRKLLDRPLQNSDTYAWAMRNLMDRRWPHLEDYIPLSGFVPETLQLISEWQHRVERRVGDKQELAAAKSLVAKIRSALQSRNFGPLCEAAENMSAEHVQQLRHSIQINDAFNDAFRNTADRQISLTRRDLETGAGGREAAASSPESELHWTTAKAREQKLSELRELNTVIIPANSVEIEKARAEGDLKENAGYIYAKEKQKLLMQQLARLQQDLSTARVYPKKNVRVDSVGFGVEFWADNLKTGEKEHFTVLGRFETDPDKYILSYQSPFMEHFIGKKAGDQVLVKHPGGGETPYKIDRITNGLESGEWDMPEETQQ
jgi:transcription elongation factor GreA